MKKKLKKVGAVLTASAVVMTSIFTIAPAKMVKGADEETPSFVVEKDPYVISEEDAQPYDTADLKLTPGLTYLKDGEEIEVTGAIDTQSFCADPTCMEVDGKIYVYGTTDQRSYQKNSSTTTNNNNGPPPSTSKQQQGPSSDIQRYPLLLFMNFLAEHIFRIPIYPILSQTHKVLIGTRRLSSENSCICKRM